ncbi:electron transfer flavoprotein subunit alpha/FixB family protein [Spirochaetia bacterium]|nr:electron transfer flavoprotein subunit alpha/FixB family protein [Spirochaetia bacterium]
MGDVWTMAEQYKGQLKNVSFELLARGRSLANKLGTKLVAVLIGWNVSPADMRELILRGADEVYSVQDEGLKEFTCGTYAAILLDLIREHKPEIVLAAATTSGRTLMPYTAVLAGTGLTADCTALDIEEGTGNLLQTRPAIGGNIMATIKTPDHRPQMATIRPKSTRPLDADPRRTGVIKNIALKDSLIDERVSVLGLRKEGSDFVNLEEADVVVAGGRGLKKQENFRLIKELAESLGAVVGASRDAVDRGWISYPHQIGLSGKTISPKVYIGIGISGAIQHLAGIKTSETIVAINNDPEANLLKIADFAILGDAFQVVPELIKIIRQKKGAK